MNIEFLTTLGVSLETAELIMEEHSKALAESEKNAEIKEAFNSVTEEWVNVETKEHYLNKFISEIEKEENKDLSLKEVLDKLLTDKEGNYREGIFKKVNPNPLEILNLNQVNSSNDVQSNINSILGGK